MMKNITRCRICGNEKLISIVNLGSQYLTGVFPKSKNEKHAIGPLELLKCHSDGNDNVCGLVQLGQSYNLNEMYGANYGYRSGLNLSMVEHLHGKVDRILDIVSLLEGDLVVDIGSNDSTLLQAYPQNRYQLVGIDPTGTKFREYYPKHITLLPEFFSAKAVKKAFANKKAKIITSISMFYDIEALEFMREVYDVLDDNGVWVFEQSYMPTMLSMNAYDTICHEHLEYYRLKQIKYMADVVGFKIIDIEFNQINGGSFSVMVAKEKSQYRENTTKIANIIISESRKGLDSLKPYVAFKRRIYKHRDF